VALTISKSRKENKKILNLLVRIAGQKEILLWKAKQALLLTLILASCSENAQQITKTQSMSAKVKNRLMKQLKEQLLAYITKIIILTL